MLEVFRNFDQAEPGKVQRFLTIIRNIPQFPWSRVIKVTQDLYHQQYYEG